MPLHLAALTADRPCRPPPRAPSGSAATTAACSCCGSGCWARPRRRWAEFLASRPPSPCGPSGPRRALAAFTGSGSQVRRLRPRRGVGGLRALPVLRDAGEGRDLTDSRVERHAGRPGRVAAAAGGAGPRLPLPRPVLLRGAARRVAGRAGRGPAVQGLALPVPRRPGPAAGLALLNAFCAGWESGSRLGALDLGLQPALRRPRRDAGPAVGIGATAARPSSPSRNPPCRCASSTERFGVRGPGRSTASRTTTWDWSWPSWRCCRTWRLAPRPGTMRPSLQDASKPRGTFCRTTCSPGRQPVSRSSRSMPRPTTTAAQRFSPSDPSRSPRASATRRHPDNGRETPWPFIPAAASPRVGGPAGVTPRRTRSRRRAHSRAGTRNRFAAPDGRRRAPRRRSPAIRAPSVSRPVD